MPLTGPHPLGVPRGDARAPMPSTPSNPSNPQPMNPHVHPSTHAQPPMQPNHGYAPLHHGHPMAESVSLLGPPPKKSNTIVFIVIGLAALALIGIGLGALVIVGAKSDTPAVASASASATAAPVDSTPPVPATTTPPPVAEEPDAAETEAVADAAPSPQPTMTTTTTALPTPAPATDVVPTAQPVVVKDAGPPPDPNAWNESAARARLNQANGILAFCKKEGGVTGPGSAAVTFGNDGNVTGVAMDPPYTGTPSGDCVAGHFKRTKVNPFQGSPQTIKHTFEVPK